MRLTFAVSEPCSHLLWFCRGFISLGTTVNKRAAQVLEQYSPTSYEAEIKVRH